MNQPAQTRLKKDVSHVPKAQMEKRRAQNRLAQKNYRKRMREIGLRAKQSAPTAESDEAEEPLFSALTVSDSFGLAEHAQSVPSHSSVSSYDSGQRNKSAIDYEYHPPWTRHAIKKCNLHRLGRPKFNQMMVNLENLVRQSYQHESPRSDMLLTLIQFNVFRALVQNTASMGFTMDWLKESAVSPWTTEEVNSIDLEKCPPSLRPTALQHMVEHHPWIDLFPLPKVRDNLLLADAYYDEDKLCNDLVEFCDVPNESTGLIVWGQPWDPAGWEVSEKFLRNWGWVIRGCDSIQLSTNYWRRKRGEPGLIFEDSSTDNSV